jgi:YidC/Oxa1 family membrane protein insertase
MNNKNLIVAFALSALVLFGWQYFVAMPQMRAERAHQSAVVPARKTPALAAAPATTPPQTPSGASLIPPQGTIVHQSREMALKAQGPRIAIDTPMLDGSIALKGARLDDLRLKKYRETSDPNSPEIVLLAPKTTAYPYYAEFGWIGASPGEAMPGDQTVWTQQGGGALSPGHPVTLSWDNGHGLVFTRVISVDDKYMFNIADRVTNKSDTRASLYPFAYVAREGVPKTDTSYLLHLGFVGVADGREIDAKYNDFKDPGTPPKTFASTGGWVGITDKYWMAAVIPPQTEVYSGAYLGSTLDSSTKAYQANYRLAARDIAPGASASVTHRLFAGAKVVDILRSYEQTQGISHFDNAVDWGWFWFITQPLFWLLDTFYKFIGNFGLAILMLTVVVKGLFFPLANASFKSMSKMKKVQPEMERLKKLHGDDPQKQQMAIMELYKREKVNPLTGCLPMLIQIPVFFSLYKVLYVTIEMRQAPFFGWIRDLSAPDPTSIINLFGLLHFDPHAYLPGFLAMLSIGVWPILMGITQWVQTKLNPAPTDPVQAKMFALMPVIFTFMFATFPAGLVIYYTWNNLLTITQQWFIMHKEGVEVHLFKNMSLRKAPK